MASFFLTRLFERRCMAAATSSLRPLHGLSSLRHLHSSSSASHDSNPNSNPSSLPTNSENESDFGFSGQGLTVYPTFPHSAHLGPVSLFEGNNGGLIGVQSTSLAPPIPAIVRVELGKESGFAVSIAAFDNVGLIPLSEAIGLEIERDDDEVVIRADSVKKKRKRKMNKHKLRKLRKKLRRKT